MINEPPPLYRDYSRDPYIKALKRSGFINRGSTLGPEGLLKYRYNLVWSNMSCSLNSLKGVPYGMI